MAPLVLRAKCVVVGKRVSHLNWLLNGYVCLQAMQSWERRLSSRTL